jgi:hypothetical protein
VYKLVIDVSHLIKYGKEALPQAISQGFTALAKAMEEVAPSIISEVFEKELAQEPNFPNDYAVHLTETAPILVSVRTLKSNSQRFYISLDMDSLGGVPELIAATHYHAQLEGGGHVELPYSEGMKLAHDAATRLEFFQAEVEGKGLEQVTHAARVEYWGKINKAPEWIFLQYGEPYMSVGPHRVSENIQVELTRAGNEISYIILSQYIQNADRSGPRVFQVAEDLFFTPGGRGSKWRNRFGFVSKPSFYTLS